MAEERVSNELFLLTYGAMVSQFLSTGIWGPGGTVPEAVFERYISQQTSSVQDKIKDALVIHTQDYATMQCVLTCPVVVLGCALSDEESVSTSLSIQSMLKAELATKGLSPALLPLYTRLTSAGYRPSASLPKAKQCRKCVDECVSVLDVRRDDLLALVSYVHAGTDRGVAARTDALVAGHEQGEGRGKAKKGGKAVWGCGCLSKWVVRCKWILILSLVVHALISLCAGVYFVKASDAEVAALTDSLSGLLGHTRDGLERLEDSVRQDVHHLLERVEGVIEGIAEEDAAYLADSAVVEYEIVTNGTETHARTR
ncbi:hypothetical protein KIPB_000275 [Kipferlia bialata]|uniref:Uncharacterized protein n=1 Tax=Kipferlia bialata TaxID=797122 RepID=A0A9K3CLU3_9EUKA|nr:hypothetical protein KIPB_000275 [Kipferlia bialata]|eukprot:g275.t1